MQAASRFIALLGTEVVEIGPVNATIHKVDECVAVQARSFRAMARSAPPTVGELDLELQYPTQAMRSASARYGRADAHTRLRSGPCAKRHKVRAVFRRVRCMASMLFDFAHARAGIVRMCAVKSLPPGNGDTLGASLQGAR
jgi:hypothetical protein